MAFYAKTKEKRQKWQGKKPSFRIGAPAYVYNLDILDNVHKLKDKVEDITLILPEASNPRNIPRQEELKELNEIRKDWNLTYTVHLPLDVDLGNPELSVRRKMAANMSALIENLSCLEPCGHILHLNLSANEPDIGLWLERIRWSIRRIAAKCEDVSEVAVENLSYPFEYIDKLIMGNGFSICTDVGHLIAAGIDPLAHLMTYLDRTRVIHLHGVNGIRDHVSLKYINPALIDGLFGLLKERGYAGVLTLEMFSEEDLEESFAILQDSLCM
ncbi:MAG: cobamide remodeling phosphodiesterase CbiR [Candidatus Omnitrophica bacterium]|nr:cobamide remodeling phosphodiesterase CbiR [Candidatus Omnitrophota bacterium]MDD5269954.1 cobamide remodeling phosphodiesterase CbiR [Candidatus Omnitrophota bacterium]MDD5737039.1 cobamide remodeling phosphodiesterase CbiR [Candidatus Omnitrophota bacterium]